MNLRLLSLLESGEGRTELNKLLKYIKKTGINESNSEIYSMKKNQSNQIQIKCLEWNNLDNINLIGDVKDLLQKCKLQPQMIATNEYYVPMADNDFAYDGQIITSDCLVHFFRSKDDNNLKLQILVQFGITGGEADSFIHSNGKMYYDI